MTHKLFPSNNRNKIPIFLLLFTVVILTWFEITDKPTQSNLNLVRSFVESDSNSSSNQIDLFLCCDGENLAVNGSFEEGSFSANGSVVDANNAMTSTSFGGIPLDSFITDRYIFWINDPTRATDGNKFIYLPEAHDKGKCVIRGAPLYGETLSSNATYQVTFDVAGFDENGTEANTNYILEFFYRNADGSQEQEMVQDEFFLECTSTPAPNPIATSSWNNLNWTRVTGEITLPPPNSSAYSEIRMILSANDGGGVLIDNVCVNKVAEAISMTAEGIDPTVDVNGSVAITYVSLGDRYEYNTTGFKNLPLTYASATNNITGIPQTVASNIPPLAAPTTYYLRVYESGNSFKDTSIVLRTTFNYPESYDCDETTLLVGDLLPGGGGQTISFPFGVGSAAPPACTDKLNYGGEGLAYCENNDKVYIARFAPNQIGVWDLQTNSLASSIPLSVGSPYDVAMTSDCNYLYVATTSSVERINLTTNTVDQTRLRADFDAVATGDGEPWGIDIHPITGEVYITFGWGSNWASHGGGDRESSILKVGDDLQGTITEVVPNESYGLFMGMKFLPNGNFWVTWDGGEPPTFPFPYVHSEEIRLYSPSGTLLESKPIIIGGNQKYFTDPNDIAFGPDGNIYVTTYAEYCVVRYMTATDTWEEYLGLDPSGATGKNLEFVCSSVFCLEVCDDGIDNDGDGLIDCYDSDCTPNLVVNSGFEDTGSATFSTTFEGSPAEPLPRSSTLLPNWVMDYSCLSPPAPCPDGYLIDDSADLVNNPEGNHFIWFAGSGYCARQDFTVEAGVCYEISMDIASWASPGPQTGTEATFAVEAFGGGIDDGAGGTFELFRRNIPESSSWSNLNWQSLSFTWDAQTVTTNTKLFFSQKGGSSSNGLAIDNIRVQKICCETEICDDGIDNDGNGLIDCADDDCPSCISQDCEDGVQVIATTEQSASGVGTSGTPSLSNFFIPEGNNRALFIAAYFEREHCQAGDDCTSANTAGTGLGDNFASPSAMGARQITARFTGVGGSVDKLNPLFLPDGDLRFGIQVRGVTDDYSTAFYSREAYYIAIYEDDINTLLSGAGSGNITVTLPDVNTPLDEADEAIILGYAFANVGQTSSGIVRSGSDIMNTPDASYPGSYILSDVDLDYLQEPNEAEDGILVLGMNGIQDYGFENISGFSTITNTSVSNNSGSFQEYNEGDGFSLTGQFRSGPSSGIIDNISMQSSAPSSQIVNGGFMSIFTIESCSGIEICGDGIDNDSDGDTDFNDSDCDICNTSFSSEKFYISKYGSSSCGDDVLVLDWGAGTTTATNEQNLGQDVGGAGWSDIAFTPDGQLYGNWTSNNDNMELYSIDPLSGRYINYICQIDGVNSYVTQWELVSDIDGFLYTILGDGTTTALYKYKPTDTNSDNICDDLTLVLDLTATGLVGDGDLAWSNGLLYWSATVSNNVSSPAQLVEINIQTGTYTIHPLVDGLGNNLLNVDAVVNDSEGNLIIGDQNSVLYEVDKTDFSVSVAYNLSNNCGAIGGLSTQYEFIQSAPCPEICDNGIDDDGDGLIDCADCDDCATSTLCNDNDNDGIGDFCDLDDDNDGIPDSEERCRQNDQVAYDRAFPGENINGDLDVNFSGQLGLTGRIVTSFGSGGSSSNPIYEDATTGLGITSIGGGGATTGAQTIITFNTTVTMEQFIVTSVAKDYSGSYDESQEIRFYAKGTQVEFIPTIVGTNGNSNVYATYNTSTGVALGEDPTVAGTGGEAGFHFVIDRGVDSIVVMQHTGATFDNVGIRFFLICSDRDIDNDGVPDYFDLDSDNDGIFDLDEAGHTAADANDDGIIDGSNSSFGTNGFFDGLETSPDDGIINYTLAISDGATDGTYDAVKLDSDGDGCFDALEAGVSDSDNDGIAGTGTPTVDGNGLVTGITYTSPPNNNWQNPLIGLCLSEICDDGIDNDGDGNTDCTDTDCTPDANPATINTCDNSNMAGSGSFILHDANLTVSTESGVIISYHLTISDAQNGTNDLISPYNSTDVTVYVRIERLSTGCYNTAAITLNVTSKCPENCNNELDDDGDGLIDCQDPDCPCCKAYAPTLEGLKKNNP